MPSASRSLDFASVIGLLLSFSLIGAAIFWGGSFSAFFDLPSVLIVVGGTIFVTLTSYSIPEVFRAQGVMAKFLTHRLPDATETAYDMMLLAEKARKDGLLALQQQLSSLTDMPLLQKGLGMAVDGMGLDEIEKILRSEIAGMQYRHVFSAGVFRRAAEVAPAMGLIGTLVGLVQMLGSLNEPGKIGPSMAVALLTTLYGAMLAHMLFIPIAAKLERNSNEEVLLQRLYLLTTLSIARQENPRRLEAMLNTVLPPSQRIYYYTD